MTKEKEYSLAERVALLPRSERDALLADLDAARLEYDWSFFGRPSQFAPEGFWTVWLIQAGRGYGKALESSTPIPTPDGFTAIGELRVGDTVYDHAGRPTSVSGVFPQGERECVRVTFDDGQDLVADLDHLWTVLPGGKPLTRYTHDVDVRERRDDWWSTRHAVTVSTSRLKIGDTVPVFAGLDIDQDVDLPVDPYTLGAWLGDGSSGDCSICGVDDYIFDRIAEAYELEELKRDQRSPHLRAARFGYVAPTRNRGGVYGMSCNGMNKTLRDVNVYRNKHIPSEYLRASTRQRLALLQGIMDTDGTISKNGLQTGVGFVNRQLRDDVAHLVRTLGVKPYTHELMKGVAGRPETIRPFYSVDWRAAPDLVPFGLPRKIERIVDMPRPQATRKLHRRVVSIESVGLRDATCIKVDAESELFLAGESYITTHNTLSGAQWVRKVAKENPGCRIALVGRTARDVSGTMIHGDSGIMAVHPEDERPVHKISKSRVEWPNGSIAETFSSEESAQLRGPQFHFAWADEAAAWKFTKDESGLNAWSNLKIATRLGETPRILATTTPRRTEFMIELLEKYEAQEAAGEDWDEEENGRIVITRGSTFDNSSNLSTTYIADMNSEYRDTNIYDQELLGEMIDDKTGALWTPELIQSHRWFKEVYPALPFKVVAVDPSVSENPRDECGIIVLGATAHRKLHKRHAFVLEDATLHGAPSEWAAEAVRLARRYSCPIIAEGTQGQALVKSIIHGIDPGVDVLLVQTGRQGKKARAEPVLIPYQQGRVHHAADGLEKLELQLTTWDPEISKRSPDRLDALVHGVTALLIKPPKDLFSGGLEARSAAFRRLPQGRGTGLTRLPGALGGSR